MRHLSDKTIIGALRCPVCGADVKVVSFEKSASILCNGEKTHCYDIASSGYVNLCPPQKSGSGDSKEAVKARSMFLDTGMYEPVATAIADVIEELCEKNSFVVDAGCGEGYYSAIIADRGLSVYGADISKFAVDAAAKRIGRQGRENVFFSTASIFELPLATSSADAIVNIFAPCSETEFSRVLRDGGILLTAWAGERHLMGLKEIIYDSAHVNTGRADLPEHMEKLFDRRVKYSIQLTSEEQILDLFSMTPYYWRTSSADREKLLKIHELETEVDVMLTVYKNFKARERD